MATKRNTYRVDEAYEEEFNIKHILLASKYIKKYLKRMIAAIVLSAIGGATALLAPMITKKALDEAVPSGDVHELIVLVSLLAGVFVVSILFTTLRSRVMVNVSQNIIYDIRRDLFAHLQKLSFQYFDDSESRLGKIMISDMYRYGRYVKKDREKCREILEELMSDVECEKDDGSGETFLAHWQIPEKLKNQDGFFKRETCLVRMLIMPQNIGTTSPFFLKT